MPVDEDNVLNLLSDTFGHTENESDGPRTKVGLYRIIAQFGDEEMEEEKGGDGFHSPLKGLQHEKLHALHYFGPKAVIFRAEI